MIVILMMSSGEELIGDVEVHAEHFEIFDPMHIVDTEIGMKLQNSLLLSDSNKLIFKSKDVITYYKPSNLLVEYYQKAALYSKKYTKPSTISQLKNAIHEIDIMLDEENKEKAITKTQHGSDTIH